MSFWKVLFGAIRDLLSRALWACVMVGGGVAGYQLYMTHLEAESAPQQAAGAALAAAWAVVPYVLARAFDEITRSSPPSSALGAPATKEG